MIHTTYPNARPSHLKVWADSSSWGVKSKRLEIVPLTHILTQVGWRIQNSTKESSLSEIMTLPLQSRRWSQRWTNWRRHVSSTMKLEDITMFRSTPSNSVNNFSIVLWPCWLVKFGVCMMMFVFMTLFGLLLCDDCWCIVGLLPTMTSVA